ncbi:hypothetical protein [Rivularia sp. UHCC 0363]|uniref:hypothetical protein n=1 Tax=Rivularia sp. UHCC 0363 TaxID=3110244 RepID=UPI002B20CB56|nr:hypothetical protein [Rivularia sp. UHCC 0363]MEA5598446.1 hypothetical protein [Rivularia sp. UHCC 0363]
MANITINELFPTGSELFLDSESFLSELVDEETNLTYGGEKLIRPIPTRPCLTRPIFTIKTYPIKPCITRPPFPWAKA